MSASLGLLDQTWISSHEADLKFNQKAFGYPHSCNATIAQVITSSLADQPQFFKGLPVDYIYIYLFLPSY